MKKKLCIMLAAACVGVGAVGFSACEDELKTFEYAKFENATYAYDGLEKALTVSGVPNGATVSYSADHTQTDVGEYPITATIECEGYETLTLSATLTITYSEAYYLQSEINGLIADLKEEAAEEKAALEAKIAELKTSSESAIAQLEAEIAEAEEKIATLTATVTENKTALQAEIAAAEEKIATLTATVAANKAALEEGIADLEEKHDGKVLEIEGLIAALQSVDASYAARLEELEEKVYALLQVEYHTVNFDANGGSAVASQTIVDGKKATLPETPTKTGYDFVGWYLGEEKWSFIGYSITEDITLTAKWTPIVYTITYELNGGENADNPTQYTVETETLSLNETTKTGYKFTGWYADEECTQKVVEIASGSYGNKILYAGWEAVEYTITYVLEDGENNEENPETFTVEDGVIELAEPTRTAYDFKGWCFNGTKVDTINSLVAKDITLTAEWTPIVYTITYELNGGENADNPTQYTVETETLSLKEARKNGYKFVGWFADEELENKVQNIEKGSYGNKTLYAGWTDGILLESFGVLEWSEDGSVTLDGVRPVHAGFGSGVGSLNGVQNSYIAYKGEYGVGNYMSFTYTGNNMPYVMFFADAIDGFIGGNRTTDKGLVIMNGIVEAGNTANVANSVDTLKWDALTVWGPNRYKGTRRETETALVKTTQYPALMQSGLNSDEYKNTNFKYVVGTFINSNSNTVYVDITLYNLDASTTDPLYEVTFNTCLTEDQLPAGNIVVQAPMKGHDGSEVNTAGLDSTFKYTEPYFVAKTKAVPVIIYKGEENTDGSVTLQGVKSAGNGWSSGIASTDNSYVGLVGDYGVGTFIDITFKGANMPHVVLLADTINGCLATGTIATGNAYNNINHGYVLANGMDYGTSYHYGHDTLAIVGPSRFSNAMWGCDEDAVQKGSAFGWDAMVAASQDIEYKYTVGTMETDDGMVMIIAELYNNTTGELLASARKLAQVYTWDEANSKYVSPLKDATRAEVEAVCGTNILLAGSMKVDASGNAIPLTFSYSEPYKVTEKYSDNEI